MSDRDEAKEKKVKLKSTVGNFNSKVNIVIMVLGSLFASRAQSFSIFSIIFYIYFLLPPNTAVSFCRCIFILFGLKLNFCNHTKAKCCWL